MTIYDLQIASMVLIYVDISHCFDFQRKNWNIFQNIFYFQMDEIVQNLPIFFKYNNITTFG